VAIAAGEWNSMALKSDGTVVAWGAGTNNAGSDPNFGQSKVPSGLSNVMQIATGGLDDLVLRTDGSIVGWGDNGYGEDNAPGGLNVASIAAGYGFALALKADGTVVGWGDPFFSETTPPTGLSNVVVLSVRGSGCLALVGSGPPPSRVPISAYRRSSGMFSVSLSSQAGRVYALEYKTSLADPSWTALPLVAGNAGTLILTDTSITNAPQRFYRVRRW
jgi:hypothetical protein